MKKLTMLLALPLLFSNVYAQEESAGYESPLQAVLADNNFIENTELSTLNLSQQINRGESATKAMITLTESGLMDDSIYATKTTYFIKQNDDALWVVDEKFKSQKCQRGENTGEFTTDLCP